MTKRHWNTDTDPHYRLKPSEFIDQWRQANPAPPEPPHKPHVRVDRAKVIQYHKWGWKAHEIASRLDICEASVWGVLRKWREGLL